MNLMNPQFEPVIKPTKIDKKDSKTRKKATDWIRFPNPIV
jgi:hypothetical protein